MVSKKYAFCTIIDTHTPVLTAIFQDNLGYPDAQPPVIPILSIVTGQAKLFVLAIILIAEAFWTDTLTVTQPIASKHRRI